MHIFCVVTHYCLPHVGGIEQFSFEQSRYLVKQGHQVTVVSSNPSKILSVETIDGIRIQRLPVLNFLEQKLGIPYPIYGPSLVKKLQDVIIDSDICLIHSIGFLSSYIAAQLCVHYKKPYIVYQHNARIPYQNPLLNIAQRLNDLLMGRFVALHAKEVLCISHHTDKYIKSLVNRNTHVLYSGVDHLRFVPTNHRPSVRHILGLPKDKFLVLTTRRLVFKNSVDTLLIAANMLRYDRRIEFVIIGDGPQRRNYQKFMNTNKLTNCRLLGFIPDELLADYYRAVDLFVIPSRSEGLGLVVLEAMASGLAVIATRAGGQVEVIQDGISGFLVDPCAPDQIASIISLLADSPDLAASMGRHGRDLVLQKFQWGPQINTFIKILQKTVNENAIVLKNFR